MSKANHIDSTADATGQEVYRKTWPATNAGNVVEEAWQETDPGDPDGDPPIPPTFGFVEVRNSPLTAAELARWDDSIDGDEVSVAQASVPRQYDWLKDKATKLNTAEAYGGAVRPTDQATSLAFLQWLWDNLSTWMDWDEKVYSNLADLLRSTGRVDLNDQDPV